MLLRSRKILKSIRKITVPLLLGALMISASGCAAAQEKKAPLTIPMAQPQKVTYETVEAKISSIENSVEIKGTFYPVIQQNLYYTRFGGLVKKVNVKDRDTVKKGDVLFEIDAGSLGQNIQYQEMNLEQARLSYDKLKSSARPVSDYELQLAEMNVEENTIKLQNMKDELETANLKAPFDGIVSISQEIKEGDTVNTYQVLATLSDPTSLQMYSASDGIEDFKLGADVEISTDNWKMNGSVVGTPNDVPQDADQNLKRVIIINPEKIPEGVRIGTTVDVKLVIAKKESVVVIPRQLVQTFSGRTYVYVLENGKRKERDVEVGITTATEAEIRKGLAEGELLVKK